MRQMRAAARALGSARGGDREWSLPPRYFALVGGTLLLTAGASLTVADASTPQPQLHGLAGFVGAGLGLALLVLAALPLRAPGSLRLLARRGRIVWSVALVLFALAATLTFLGSVYATYFAPANDFYTTDAGYFTYLNARELLAGHNPYTSEAPFAGALALYPHTYATPLHAGLFAGQADHPTPEQVHAAQLRYLAGDPAGRATFDPRTLHSYPALSFLLYVPLVWGGLRAMLALNLLVFAALFVWLVWRAPPRERPLAALVGSTSLLVLHATLLVNFEVLSVALLLVAWHLRRRSWWGSAVLLGLACAVKQYAWFFVPFFVLEAWLHGGGRAALRRAAVAGGAFLLPNLPFILADPRAWASSMLLPMSLPLFPSGTGLIALSAGHVLPYLPQPVYAALEVLALAALLAAVWRWRAALAEAIPVLAPLPLFFAYRSFTNYFAFVPLLALYAALTLRRGGSRAPGAAFAGWGPLGARLRRVAERLATWQHVGGRRDVDGMRALWLRGGALALASALLLFAGITAYLPQSGRLVAAWLGVATALAAAVGLGLCLAVMLPGRPRLARPLHWGARVVLGGMALLSLLVLVGTVLPALRAPARQAYTNDVISFTAANAQVAARGGNPYTSDSQFAEVLRQYPQAPATPLRAGLFGTGTNYPAPETLFAVQRRYLAGDAAAARSFEPQTLHSYPALAFLLYVPLVWAGVGNLLVLHALLYVALLAWLIWLAPQGGRLPVALAALAATPVLARSLLVDTEIVAVALVLLAWHLRRRSWLASAVLLGLACAFKQYAWFFVPFFVLEAWLAGGWRDAARRVALAGAAFLLPNLPYLLADPAAWGASLLLPMRLPLFPMGVGIVAPALGGLLPVAWPPLYAALEGLALLAGLAAYVRWPRLRAGALVLALLPLFFAFRSPDNYFAFAPWLALYAVTRLPLPTPRAALATPSETSAQPLPV